MVVNLFGLAKDGKTNARGMPNLLQTGLLAQEFEDVLYFTKPPRAVQKVLFAALAPVARLFGYRGSYPEYLNRRPSETVEVEPWPSMVQVCGPSAFDELIPSAFASSKAVSHFAAFGERHSVCKHEGEDLHFVQNYVQCSYAYPSG
jgi:hypothetical protein